MMQWAVVPSLVRAKKNDKCQFERHGYFVAKRLNHMGVKLVFNLAVGLRNS